MRILPINNTNFGKLHIINMPASKRAFKEIFSSDEKTQTVKDTLKYVDKSTGNVDVFLKARPFLVDEAHGMAPSWQFQITDSDDNKYVNINIPKSYDDVRFASEFNRIKDVENFIPKEAKIKADVDALHDQYE